jgi:putative ABC transport system permease protein
MKHVQRRVVLFVVLNVAVGLAGAVSMHGILSGLIRGRMGAHTHVDDRLARLWVINPRLGVDRGPFTVAEHRRLAAQVDSLADLTAYASRPARLQAEGRASARVSVLYVSPEYFSMLRTPPLIGRALGAREGEAADPAVLSFTRWQTTFGSDAGILAREVRLDRRPYRVVGVMPDGFGFPGQADVWVPLTTRGSDPLARAVFVAGRLEEGASWDRARSELDAARSVLERPMTAADAGWALRLVPEAEEVDRTVRNAIALAGGLALVVLLLACANAGAVLSARAVRRELELGIRMAIGATRGTIVRQLAAEHVALTIAGGAIGVPLGVAVVRLARHAVAGFAPASVAAAIKVDSQTIALAVAAAVLSALVFGLAPVLHALRINPAAALTGRARRPLLKTKYYKPMDVIAAIQVTLATVLVIYAAFLVRFFWELEHAHDGFDASNVLAAAVDAGDAATAGETLLEAARAVPGVRAVALATAIPGVRSGAPVQVVPARDGAPPPLRSWVHAVSSDYFRTLRIAAAAGRGFDASDDAGAPKVAIVSRSVAARLGAGALGEEIDIGVRGAALQRATVVGIADDVAFGDIGRRLGSPAYQVYVPLAQAARSEVFLLVRYSGPADRVAAELRRRIATPEAPLDDLAAIEERIRRQLAGGWFMTRLLGSFAALALFLASFGVYGVMSQTAAIRSREIAIRLSLGARPRHIARAILGRNAALLGGSLVIAGLATLLVARLTWSLLVGVVAPDPRVWIAIWSALASAGTVAVALPTLRALRRPFAETLRAE